MKDPSGAAMKKLEEHNAALHAKNKMETDFGSTGMWRCYNATLTVYIYYTSDTCLNYRTYLLGS